MGAADDLLGLPGCQNAAASVHPDVWYTITATGPQLNYVVATAGAPGAPFEVLVYDGACAAGLALLNYECGNGTVSGGVGALVTGRVYRIVVASASVAAAGAFTIRATISTPPALPSQDCNLATILTSAATFAQGTINSGSGVVDNEVTTGNSCFGSQSGSNTNERQSKWFKFVAGTTGRLLFNINPNTSQDDYDWAVWDVTGDPTGCTTKGNALACNWTGARGATGLSLCPGQEPGYLGGNQFDNTTTNQTGANAPITIQAGRIYALLVDNFSTSNDGFSLLLGGACAPPAGQVAAQYGLDAAFTAITNCNSVEFRKRNPLVSTTGFSFFWNFGDGTSSTDPAPTHVYNPLTPGASTFVATLRITDPFGNVTISSLPVTAVTVLGAVVASVQTPICSGDTLTLTASGGATYMWSPATGLSSTTDSLVRAAPLVTTTYQVIVANGVCSDTVSVRVEVTPRPTTQASVAQPSLCAGESTTLTVSGADRYEWSPATGLSSTTDPVVTATPAVTTTYIVTGFNGQCAVTDTVTVMVTPQPVTLATVAQPRLCSGSSTTLTVTGADRYEWSPAAGLSSTTDSTVIATPAVTTTYIVTGFNGQCSLTDTVTIVVTPQPVVLASVAQPSLCEGGSTVLTATGADRYEWSPAAGLSSTTDSTVTATPAVTTTYTVTGFSANGECFAVATSTITVVPPAQATGTISQVTGIAPLTTNFNSTVPEATAWLWNFGDGQTSTLAAPTHTYESAGTFTVTLAVTYGVANCQTGVAEIGKVVVTAPIVYNVITPNGDGLNETFSAAVSNSALNLRIFNRWGREVYAVENYQQNWKGDDLPAGTYYYHLKAADGKDWKGWLEIVR